ETGRRLEGMAERVAEIEERALAALALVGGDDRRLGAAARDHGMAPRRRVAGEQRCAVGLQPGEEGCVADKAVFDDLGVAGGELARRQRRQRVAVGEDEARLM